MPGDIADSMIEKMIWGCNDDFDDLWEYGDGNIVEPRTATEVAEERLDEVSKDKRVKDLNKGVINW
jgi:hypothetical protein